MNSKKKIAILGSTGSIGGNTLEVIAASDRFEVVGLACGHNLRLLRQQIQRFRPGWVSVAAREDAIRLREEFPSLSVAWGEAGLVEVASIPEADLVVSALVGARGIAPTLAAIEAKKDVALANKEVLIAAGELMTRAARARDVKLLPIDSEHSAIFQVLEKGQAVPPSLIRKITLTASGGPFLRRSYDTFSDITPDEALKHPNWLMGKRVTVDSATLMNKGFEVIEAFWLFGLPPRQIEVVIHPQSIVHGLVTFQDGNTLACLSAPDMKAPIAFALSYPERIRTEVVTLDLLKVQQLTFEAPDFKKFPLLKLAYKALEQSGVYPCILNAADEVAVAAFLDGRLSFSKLPGIVEQTLSDYDALFDATLEGILATDQWARRHAKSLINGLS